MKRFTVIAFLMLFVGATGSAFAANTLSAGGHKGIVRSQSGDMLGLGGFQLGGALHYGQEYAYIHSLIPSQSHGSPKLISGVGYLGVGVAPVLDIAINLPVYYDYASFGKTNAKGVGDLEASIKLAGFVLKGDESPVTSAYYMAFQFPTGKTDEGFFPRHAYYGSVGNWSSGEILYHPMLVSTIHFERMKGEIPLQINLNLGGVFNAPKDNNAATASMSLGYFPNEIITLFAEISMEERFITVHKKTFFSDLLNDPIYVTPGVKVTIPKTNLSVILAGDFGISEADEAYAQTSVSETGTTILHQANPLYNAYFGLNLLIPANADVDGDGIKNKEDKCPKEAEDKDGFEDTDGCPDYDNDKDGIPDSLDKCPDTVGIIENKGCPDRDSDRDGIIDRLDKCPKDSGIAENTGCPDVDSDKDGVVDRLDKCPKDSGSVDNNGCPDLDGDNDGVVDRLDKCLVDKEDKDGFQDADGCPDYDNDNDGIPDSLDKCPNNPGPAKNNGCPMSKELGRGQLILKGVNFESGKAILLAGSYKVLDEIATSLREWPEVRIEIQGHTDNTGVAERNLTLSQARAETVRQYLLDKGIAPERLSAIGYGQDRPIADNKTAAGRAQNRRVELSRKD
jgi:outer membrane protein OmpA-like peptidoglycan-associated protein